MDTLVPQKSTCYYQTGVHKDTLVKQKSTCEVSYWCAQGHTGHTKQHMWNITLVCTRTHWSHKKAHVKYHTGVHKDTLVTQKAHVEIKLVCTRTHWSHKTAHVKYHTGVHKDTLVTQKSTCEVPYWCAQGHTGHTNKTAHVEIILVCTRTHWPHKKARGISYWCA
jgi:predicted transposase YbfD/YdcC